MDLFLYQPGWSERRDAAWLFVNPFSGISSYGGLIGGTLGFFVFAFWSRVKRLRYADAALAPGKVGNDAAPPSNAIRACHREIRPSSILPGPSLRPDSSALDASVMARGCGPLPE